MQSVIIGNSLTNAIHADAVARAASKRAWAAVAAAKMDVVYGRPARDDVESLIRAAKACDRARYQASKALWAARIEEARR